MMINAVKVIIVLLVGCSFLGAMEMDHESTISDADLNSLMENFHAFGSTGINFQVASEPEATVNITTNKAIKSSAVRTSPEKSITKTIFSCHMCSYSNNDMSPLRIHLESAHGLYLYCYACNFCDERFTKDSVRRSHENICPEKYNGKPKYNEYKCRHCCRGIGVNSIEQNHISFKRQLSLHEWYAHSEKIISREAPILQGFFAGSSSRAFNRSL